jgi:transposase
MATRWLPDALWQEIAPLLPAAKPRRFHHPGRKPLDRRQVLRGILFVLKTGMAWDDLPTDLGLGCGRTCHDYLRDLQRAGVWDRLHTHLLSQLNRAGRLDWELGVVDSMSAKAPLGGADTGPNPTDRRKSGTKLHVLTDSQGIPVAVQVSAANTPDINRVIPLLVNTPPVGGKPGPPRRRFARVLGDRGYDSEPHQRVLRWLGIIPWFGRRRTSHGSGLGVLRWVVERTNAWLHAFGRLRRRLDKLTELHLAFAHLACVLICWRFL